MYLYGTENDQMIHCSVRVQWLLNDKQIICNVHFSETLHGYYEELVVAHLYCRNNIFLDDYLNFVEHFVTKRPRKEYLTRLVGHNVRNQKFFIIKF